jgi:hypothetical protein
LVFFFLKRIIVCYDRKFKKSCLALGQTLWSSVGFQFDALVDFIARVSPSNAGKCLEFLEKIVLKLFFPQGNFNSFF